MSRSRTRRGFRILAAAMLVAAGVLPASVPGLRSPSPVLAASGGCAPSSPTCFLFDVSLSGTGFGTYRTKNPVDGTYTRIVCEYGNESQAGVCGWGYEVSMPGYGFKVLYSLLPAPGSQACQGVICYGSAEFEGSLDIYSNYAENTWTFELIDKFQIDVTIDGTGEGSVTSEPIGIDCPDDCDDLFAANLPVTLTATPSDGSVFGGWGGACDGSSATCVITSDFLQSVTATFNVKPTAPPPTRKPTPEPTDEPTDEPTEAPTEAPAETAPTAATEAPSASPASATGASTSGPTAKPTPPSQATSVAASGGTLPIIAGLAVLLVILVGGTVFFARRGRAPAG